jgi:hypothetical protein
LSKLYSPDSETANGEGCLRVLHVDDDAGFLEVSKEILVDLDSRFEVDQASSVDEARAARALDYQPADCKLRQRRRRWRSGFKEETNI